MKFSRIEIYSAGRLRVTLNLSELRHQTPYVIKAMSGLDITEVSSRFHGFSDIGEDGFRVPLYEPVLPEREIAVRIGYRPNYANYTTSSDLRDELYRLLGASQTNRLELRFYNDANALMYIKGEMTKLEPSLFSEESEAILTFKCDDPIFRGLMEVSADTPTTGSIEPYDGQSTFQHGLFMEIKIVGTTSGLYVRTVQGDNTATFAVNVSSGFYLDDGPHSTLIANDLIQIDTRTKLANIILKRTVLDPPYTYVYQVNILDKVLTNSIWPRMHPKENRFETYSVMGDYSQAPNDFQRILWVPHYSGV